ncbi:MAG: pyrroloquinoline quinone biosynthesis protein PqqB [Acidobacteria bacterium]|nr:MAG: pyrroloquinoline quinone biosynthesis protein PqqB [Acidobacteriota bacterium]REK02900.1 MAG: pyrroloquinoline quinone biosynthesis protein PqqB [Acidobacteriota bacterium]REK13296.1 MAG: pyrroloquinoline quinone biosynthesis protein PqqB [Acidobacteriota bacterium]REK41290.1 MAG: pyrroloquinoline quinone biosynthesis protein PqqB [Acidobacteriota bacterium]
MKNNLLTIFLIFAASLYAAAAEPYVLVLGIGQDAGVPQIGCGSPYCEKAWKDRSLRRTVSSIALVDPESGERWIFDATPDLPEQFQFLKHNTDDDSNALAGVFLTHAHMGHYTGLMYLGFESMNAKGVPVYAMPRMRKFLSENGPWSQLVEFKNIELRPLENGAAVKLNKRLSVTPFLVPHRDEYSETVGYRIVSGNVSLLFIPDIDKWEKWDRQLSAEVIANDFLFVDATFFEDGEIPRPMSEVQHPFVSETMNLLKDLPPFERQKVHFIHFNHSNPIVQGSQAAIRKVENAGFKVASEGLVVKLAARTTAGVK